ncbi:hypothetical protein [Emticicia sp. BO119]|uniref:hypothetical protein n=1 Tax=Emticicia sp. BO119 TaxID=2757768 RepID=UPI0015F0BB93|nr:hypothetical protein [Emticicia sp. BO119]MBA4853799.1 hypothetical protein [Emticicia sp. BO119]
MKRLIILLIAFAVYSTTSAQSLNYMTSAQIPKVEIQDGKKVTTVEVKVQTGSVSSGVHYNSRLMTFLGSPFFIDVFETITFTIDSSTAPITAPVMLNLANDILLVKLADKITPLTNINFTLAGHDFVMLNGRYYEQLYNGKVKLLKKYVRDLVPVLINNTIASSGYGKSSQQYDGEIRNKEIYYLVFHDDKMKAFNMTPKSVVSVLTKENKVHFVNGDFARMNENDAYLKALENISDIDEKELVKILSDADKPVLP